MSKIFCKHCNVQILRKVMGQYPTKSQPKFLIPLPPNFKINEAPYDLEIFPKSDYEYFETKEYRDFQKKLKPEPFDYEIVSK